MAMKRIICVILLHTLEFLSKYTTVGKDTWLKLLTLTCHSGFNLEKLTCTQQHTKKTCVLEKPGLLLHGKTTPNIVSQSTYTVSVWHSHLILPAGCENKRSCILKTCLPFISCLVRLFYQHVEHIGYRMFLFLLAQYSIKKAQKIKQRPLVKDPSLNNHSIHWRHP